MRLGEDALARSADADELDRHLELALDELDVAPRRLRQVVARAGAVERRLPAGQGLPDRARVVEVALVRREVRGLRAVAQPVATQTGSSREVERTSSFVSASEVIPFTRTA